VAKAVGVSLRAVQRLWEAHRLQPHRILTFKRSNDPEFAEKVEDIVDLCMDSPKHAVVVLIDEKKPNPGARPHAVAKGPGLVGLRAAKLCALLGGMVLRRF
jgi:hypothetical protein